MQRLESSSSAACRGRDSENTRYLVVSTTKLFKQPLKKREPINEDKIAIGSEESAGLPSKSHYAEKVGVLAYLLATQAVATRGARMTKQLSELQARVEDPIFAGSIGN